MRVNKRMGDQRSEQADPRRPRHVLRSTWRLRARTMARRNGRGVAEEVSRLERSVSLSESASHSRRVSSAVAPRLEVKHTLSGHAGCVNTVAFADSGTRLLSGSDDQRVAIWHWPSQSLLARFHTGHTGNIFQARTLPNLSCSVIASCAADGALRVSHLRDGSPSHIAHLGSHSSRAHKMAMLPHTPQVIFTAGEDGLVKRADLRDSSFESSIFAPVHHDDRVGFYSIDLCPLDSNYLAVAGHNPHVYVYDVRQLDSRTESTTGRQVTRPVMCLNRSSQRKRPREQNDSDEQHQQHNTREGNEEKEDENERSRQEDHDEEGDEHEAGSPESNRHITAIKWTLQNEILASYHGNSITLFDASASGTRTNRRDRVMQTYEGHANLQTVKGINTGFYGNEDYVLSGSDDGNLFMWRKSTGACVFVSKGGSNILNCVEPHPSSAQLVTSGIEHSIKVWTPTSSKKGGNIEELDDIRTRNQQRSSRLILTLRQFAALLRQVHGSSSVEESDHDVLQGQLGAETQNLDWDEPYVMLNDPGASDEDDNEGNDDDDDDDDDNEPEDGDEERGNGEE